MEWKVVKEDCKGKVDRKVGREDWKGRLMEVWKGRLGGKVGNVERKVGNDGWEALLEGKVEGKF